MRILLLAYHFYPQKNAGVDRPFSLYKYADENGVDLHVATAMHLHEPSVSMKNVFRIESIEGWNTASLFLKKFAYKLITKIAEPFYFNIDYYWMKMMFAYFNSRALAQYDAIYCIYPSPSAVICAYHLSKKYRKPLIIDFTDSIGYNPLYAQNSFQKLTELRLERNVVRHASVVFTIAEGMCSYLKSRYIPRNLLNVYNGFDPDDFQNGDMVQTRRLNYGQIRIIHFGNINASRARDATPLFQAILKVKTELNLTKDQVKIVFVGNFTSSERAVAKELRINDIVFYEGFMDKRKGFKMILQDYDFLLLYGTPGEKSTVTSKLLEYLRLKKPILGICKDNEAEGIIRRAGAGEICDFDVNSIAGLLKKALRRNIAFNPDDTYIEMFNRRNQAKTIFDFIKKACCPK